MHDGRQPGDHRKSQREEHNGGGGGGGGGAQTQELSRKVTCVCFFFQSHSIKESIKFYIGMRVYALCE